MKFVLKDLKDLDILFKDTKALREEKSSELRLIQLKFLEVVLAELVKQKKEPNHEKGKYYERVFYAAMLLITRDINANLLMMQGSKLLNRLNYILDITKANPLEAQEEAELFESLNHFFALTYVNNDSRQGINPKNIFADQLGSEHKSSTKKLNELVISSFSYEQAATDKANKALVATGKSTMKPGSYSFKDPKTTYPAALKLFTWADLKKENDRINLAELKDKDVEDISALDKPRSTQLCFLRELIQLLDQAESSHHIPEKERTAIVMGVMHLIRGQINKEYKVEPLSHADNNSKVHTEYTKLLDAKKTSYEDIGLLVSAAYRFIHQMAVEAPGTVIDKDSKADKASIRAKHFSVALGFDVKAALTLLQTMIFDCRCKAQELCISKLPKEVIAPSAKASGNMFGFMKSLANASTSGAPAETSAAAEPAATHTPTGPGASSSANQ